MTKFVAIVDGVVAGLALFATTFYAWMIWGCAPGKES